MSIIQPFNLSTMEMIVIIDTIRPKIKNTSFENRISKLYQIILDSTVSGDPVPIGQFQTNQKSTKKKPYF